MLNSLYIKNYRNLKELTLKSLGQITLLTGKNNTGKSSVLEAIAIYVAKGDIKMIYELLEERGEYVRETGEKRNFTEDNIKLFSSFFYDRKIDYNNETFINIGTNTNIFKDVSVSIKLSKYIIVDGEIVGVLDTKDEKQNVGNKIALIITFKDVFAIKTAVFELENEKSYSFDYEELYNYENLQFVGTKPVYSQKNAENWDKITLTDKENYVIDALKTIEPNIQRLAFVGDSRLRDPIIKLSNVPNTLPLRSMGDGINRILTIILALVNAENGYLLIDEFENGLHHSVQSKLWEIIFNLAKKLNVQVFATTHSNDCIYAFEESLNDKNNTLTGKLIRLDNKKGMIKEVEFDAEDLRVFTDSQIEIR